jgi:hypothetical protein
MNRSARFPSSAGVGLAYVPVTRHAAGPLARRRRRTITSAIDLPAAPTRVSRLTDHVSAACTNRCPSDCTGKRRHRCTDASVCLHPSQRSAPTTACATAPIPYCPIAPTLVNPPAPRTTSTTAPTPCNTRQVCLHLQARATAATRGRAIAPPPHAIDTARRPVVLSFDEPHRNGTRHRGGAWRGAGRSVG